MFIIFTQNIFAGESECEKLSLLLVNTTQNTCKLTKQNLIHGYVVNTSHVPNFIPPNSTAPALDLQQQFAPIEIELSYQCGENKTITLHTRQEYAFFTAGTISTRVITSQNMKAESSINEGSCLAWIPQHGTVSWNLME